MSCLIKTVDGVAEEQNQGWWSGTSVLLKLKQSSAGSLETVVKNNHIKPTTDSHKSLLIGKPNIQTGLKVFGF